MSGYRSRVLGLLELAKTQGQIDEKADCAAAATMFLGMVQGLVTQAMAADDFTAMPALSSRLFEVFLDGLRGSK